MISVFCHDKCCVMTSDFVMISVFCHDKCFLS